jgi:hypothetical protein
MGVAHYIVLAREIEGLDTKMDGKRLSSHMESLDAAARQLGVRPLSGFFSLPPDDLAEFMDGAEDVELPPLKQFSAQDGLITIRALLARPEAQPAIQDLQDCERILCAALEHGVGWHFQIDI